MIELATRTGILTAEHIQQIRDEGIGFYNAQLTPWESISQRVMEIEITNFPNQPDPEETLKKNFFNPDNVICTVTDPKTMQIAGYTIVVPAESEYREQTSPDKKSLYPARLERPDINLQITAFVNDTAFLKEYQGYGFVKNLNELVTKQLWYLGFRFLERDAAINEGYAGKLLRAYADQIIFHENHDSVHGPQEFIRMRLQDPATTSAGIS
jgi:hypothetical protein